MLLILPDAELVSALTITLVLIKWWLFKTFLLGRRRGVKRPILTAAAFTVAVGICLRILLQQKTLTLLLMGALLAGAIWGFTFVRQNFFPSSNTPIFFVDLWLPTVPI